jgi:hypothetical protein
MGCRSFYVAQSRLDILELHGLERLPHDAEAVADARAHLAVYAAVRHGADGFA